MELDVIRQTGFSAYFLIVWDLIRAARCDGVVVGPGRGSAAGSLVSYVLRITNVDPLRYGLIFERFLNLERREMPDIDIDFDDRRRDRVIQYVTGKYGQDRVAQIITFGTMAARAAIRDVGRVLDVPLPDVDRLAKLVPASIGITLDRALAEARDLRDLYDGEPWAHSVIDIARRLEGICRNASTHAAGVVIGAEPLASIVPLARATSGNEGVVTQFDMKGVSKIGLLKIDFLGLSNLTVIQETVENVEKVRGVRHRHRRHPPRRPRHLRAARQGGHPRRVPARGDPGQTDPDRHAAPLPGRPGRRQRPDPARARWRAGWWISTSSAGAGRSRSPTCVPRWSRSWPKHSGP